MKRLFYIAAVCALCLILAPSTSNAATVYGVSFTDGNVYLIDTDAGTSNFMFSTFVNFLGATDGDNDTSFFATPAGGSLYRVDFVAETATPIGFYQGAEMKELAYDETRLILYGTDYVNLYTIDTGTGMETLIGGLGGPDAVWAMDYDASIDQIIGVNQSDNTLYHINRNTGMASPIGPTGVSRVSDVWYDAGSQKVFAVTDGESDLYEMNSSTGEMTYIATIDGNLTGLGFKFIGPIPVDEVTWGEIKARFK